MRFGVLGPVLACTDAGRPVTVPGTKVRVLLADLLAHRDQVVSADRLVDDLWGGEPPANPTAALQVRVSQLRKALDDAEPGARRLVESCAPGYVLRTAGAAGAAGAAGVAVVDADRFAALAASDDLTSLVEALELWRGQPYADVADEPFSRAEADRLAELRLAVQERLAALRLAAGEHRLVAAELAELVARHPLREGLRTLQMRALHAGGRSGEALAAYDDLRVRLADELGADPGPEPAELHRRILMHDPTLVEGPPPDHRPDHRPGAAGRPGLPAPVDALVGRGDELAELRDLLPSHRLVTLVGPGGVGKTRLAVEAARERLDLTGDAVLVELAALPAGVAADVVAERALGALDVHEAPAVDGGPATVTGRLLAAVRHRPLLLLLDNCEHLVDAAAALVARLLRDAPGVRVLATSREPLGLAGEQVWEVPPLALPADDGDLAAVQRSAAARLFTARVGARQRAFALDATTAPVVAQLCRRLDGLPLALELAATRVRALGVTGVLDRLDDRFGLLTTRERDRPARQRTLTAVIGWSWDLLDAADRRLLARLSVFADGCTPGAAQAVCDADLDALSRLVDRSLVVAEPVGTSTRYRLLESVAAFAADRLADLGDVTAVRGRHTAYFTALAERADPLLRGPGQRDRLVMLDAETANLRLALAHGGGSRLTDALTWYWFLRGRFTEARQALAVAGDPGWRAGFDLLGGRPVADVTLPEELGGRTAWFVATALLQRSELPRATRLLDVAQRDAVDAADRWTEAAVLCGRAMLAHAAGDVPALDRAAHRGDELFAAVGDRWGRLQANGWLGGLAELQAEYDRAAALHTRGLRWAEELALWPEVAGELASLAWLALQTGDHTGARELAERAYRMAVEQSSPSTAVFAEISLAFAARRDGKLDVAVPHLEHLLETAAAERQPALYLPMVLIELGRVAEQDGDRDGALGRYRTALTAACEMGASRDEAGALEAIASVDPDLPAAARALGTAAALRTATGLAPGPAERDDAARTTAHLVALLGDGPFRAAYAEGASGR